jgi:hypothetical protein
MRKPGKSYTPTYGRLTETVCEGVCLSPRGRPGRDLTCNFGGKSRTKKIHCLDFVRDHLALAALRAISRRFAAERAFALAGPPALPPIWAIWDRSSEERESMRDFPPRLPMSDRNSLTAAGVWDLGFFAMGPEQPILRRVSQKKLYT